MNSIEKNLYEFYRVFGTAQNMNLTQEDGYEMICGANNFWPQMIFNLNKNTDPHDLIPRISNDMKTEKYAPFFVAPEEYISREHTNLLKENSFAPIRILTGMSVNPENNKITTPPHECEILELVNKHHLSSFAELINKEFIAEDLIFNDTILSDLKFSNEVQMAGLFFRKTLVSALLVLIKENIAGLYFLVTRKEFQNKGYASNLIYLFLNQLYNNGVKEVVLHANHYSFGLYKKLGFKEKNRFVVYKRL